MLNSKPIKSSILYITFDPSLIDPSSQKTVGDLERQVLLQVQGEAVELVEGDDKELLLYVFNIAHGVCPEVVLKAKDGIAYLIYDHQPEEVLRAEEIETNLSPKEDIEFSKKERKLQTIDIDELWRRHEDVNPKERTLKVFEEIRKNSHKSEKTTIRGGEPFVLILAAFHMLYGISDEVWYQRNEGSEEIRIR